MLTVCVVFDIKPQNNRRAQGDDFRFFYKSLYQIYFIFPVPRSGRSIAFSMESSLTDNLYRAYKRAEHVATPKTTHVVLTKRVK